MTDADHRTQRLLKGLDLPDQVSDVLKKSRYHNLAFCLAFLERCHEIRRCDPQAGLIVSRAATSLAQKIPKKECGGLQSWCSLQVHALVVAANAQRSVSDFSGAEATCQIAQFLYLDEADPLAHADLLQSLLYLRRDQRRFDQAERYASRAIEIYKELRHHHLWGCALVDRGVLAIRSNQPFKAATDLFEAMSLIDRQQSPAYYYLAAHNLAVALADDRESNPIEALYWLRYAQQINEEPESSFSQIKLLWAEGRILEKQGMLSEAEHFLQTVRLRLLEHRTLSDYALASLDLAGVYLKQSRNQDVRTLAAELLPIFQQLRTDRDAVAGLRLFHRRAITEALSLEVLSSIKRVLRARARPMMRS
ncbi:MAG: hypothetical protein AAF560_15475 [Acidobacteriota bacterium]